MKKINNLDLPKRTAVFVGTGAMINQAITDRIAALTNMSGYPIASNVVGRIQRSIDLTSVKTMYTSFLKLRNLTRLASDVLNTMLIAKLDRNQMVRTEVIAYVAQNAENYGMRNLSDDDKDLVAYLITSSESHDASWVLDMPNDPAANLVCKISELYRSLTGDDSFTIDKTGKALNPIGDRSAIFAPESDEVKSILETRSAKNIINQFKTETKGMKGGDILDARINLVSEHLSYIQRVNALATLRVIDHVFGLLTNVDVWKAFISPRSTSDASQNKERASSLKVLASYFHSLLMFPHFFSIELFRATYDRLQEWLVPFPALPAHIIAQYDEVIRQHDVLAAGSDVATVMSAINVSSDPNLDTHISGFLKEFTVPFELSDTIRRIDQVLSNTLTPVTFESLKDLKDPKYTYLLMAHPVASVDMATDITNAVLMSNVVAATIVEAVSGIAPGISRYYPDDVLSPFKNLNFKISFPIVTQVAFSDDVVTSTSATLVNGKVHFRPLSPVSSYDYQFHVRRELMYSVFKGQDVTQSSRFLPTHIVNLDLAEYLRKTIGHDWKGMLPSSMWYGDQVLNKSILKSDKEVLRRLLEKMSGMHFDLIERTISNQFIREIWATFMSSFALMYVLPSSVEVSSITGNDAAGAMAAYLVE